MQPDELDDEEQLEASAHDNQPPFSAAGPTRDPDADPDDERQLEEGLDDTHPNTDDGIDSQELYDAGLAADDHEPNAGNAVVGYTKPEKKP